MTAYRFRPGELFVFPDVYGPPGRYAYGIMLENGKAFVISRELVREQYVPRYTKFPHTAVQLSEHEGQIPPEVRLALEAVVIALNLQKDACMP